MFLKKMLAQIQVDSFSLFVFSSCKRSSGVSNKVWSSVRTTAGLLSLSLFSQQFLEIENRYVFKEDVSTNSVCLTLFKRTITVSWKMSSASWWLPLFCLMKLAMVGKYNL